MPNVGRVPVSSNQDVAAREAAQEAIDNSRFGGGSAPNSANIKEDSSSNQFPGQQDVGPQAPVASERQVPTQPIHEVPATRPIQQAQARQASGYQTKHNTSVSSKPVSVSDVFNTGASTQLAPDVTPEDSRESVPAGQIQADNGAVGDEATLESLSINDSYDTDSYGYSGVIKESNYNTPKPIRMTDTVNMLNNHRPAKDEQDRYWDSGSNVADYDGSQQAARKRAGMFSIKKPLKFKDLPTNTFRAAINAAKENIKKAVMRKGWNGNGFTEKALADRKVNPDEVSIGSMIVSELIREPGNNLIDIVNEASGNTYTAEQLVNGGLFSQFINDINNSQIYVVASKSPVSDPSSSQLRRLKVHYGRGIKVHPTQTKIYNLDFDGDGVIIQFATDGNLFKHAMEYLINVDGNPMIDTDFFPIAQISQDKHEYINTFEKIFLTWIPSNSIRDKAVSELAEAMYYISNPSQTNPNSQSGDVWIDAINAMDKIASDYPHKNTVMAAILKDIFDNMLRIRSITTQLVFENSQDLLMDEMEYPADVVVQQVIEDIMVGNMPPNYQDFLIELGRYIGDIEGKNVMFRLGADIAKRINFSGVNVIGEDGARQLYELTLEAGMAMFMNGRANIGEKIHYIEAMARNFVIERTGFPNPNDLNGFLKLFKTNYNHFMTMLNVSKTEFGCDLDPIYSEKEENIISSDRLADFSHALVKIYGDYTIEKMFPALKYRKDITGHMKGNQLVPRYKTYTLAQLSKNNRISIKENIIKESQNKRIGSDNLTAKDIVMVIADSKTKMSSKFNKEVELLCENFANRLNDFSSNYKKRHKSQADFMAYASDLMACLHISGPDMFAYYNMDNPSAFLNSYYGQLFQKASLKKNEKDRADLIGGTRITMVLHYRLRKVQDLNAEISNLMQEDVFNNIERINDLQNRIACELSVLASSSDLWNVLVREINGNTRAFQQLKETKGNILGSYCDARVFWAKVPEKYSTLMDVLSNPLMGKKDKDAIAIDVIRQATGFLEVKASEVAYQLEIGPHSAYTTLNTMAYNDQPNVFTNIQNANNELKKFFEKSYDSVVKEIEKMEALHKGDGQIENLIHALVENPQYYMEISDDLIADMINAQMDKTSRSSEKSSQEIAVGHGYKALMQQQGGYTNAMYRSDSRVLGMISEDNLTPLDILKILDDPSMYFIVYNGNGRYILSRSALCGDDSEEALWEMLKQNPRIAAMLRMSTASTYGKNVYSADKFDFEDSFNTANAANAGVDIFKGKISAYLNTRPVFISMAAMFLPIHGRSSTSVRSDRHSTLDALRYILVKKAQIYADGGTIDIGVLLKDMGVTEESLIEIGGMDRQAARNWYNSLTESINEYLRDIGSFINDGNYRGIIEQVLDTYNTDASLSFDSSSIALAIDTRQTLTGAKTERSTEIEGGMTAENLGLGLYFMSLEDGYDIIDGSMDADYLANFAGCMTNAGVFTGNNIEELENELIERYNDPNMPLIVEFPEGYSGSYYQRSDMTLTSTGRQIPAAAMLTSIKRSKYAEEYNLKAKKSGDDGTDSITKTSKYLYGSEWSTGIIESIYETSPKETRLFDAKFKLARMLQNANRDDGFDDLDLAHYMSIASIMIKEITDPQTDESTIAVRSLGEIGMAIKANLDQQLIENGSPREIIDNARVIADNTGLESMYPLEMNSDLALYGASKIRTRLKEGAFKPSKLAKMSSPDRSFKMLEQVANREIIRFPWSGEIFEKPPKLMDGGLYKKIPQKNENRKDGNKKDMMLIDIISLKNKKKYIGKCPSNYKFVGVIDSKDRSAKQYIVPGPTSVWILESADQKAIDSALMRCYAYGMTLIFKDVSNLGDKAQFFENDITPAPFDGYLMLPFFDMRMNGSSISGPVAPPSFQYDPSWLWCTVEDSLNLYGLADGEALASKYGSERIHCNASGTESISFDDLFYTTRTRYPDDVGEVQLCTWDEINEKIINWKDGGPMIDIGIARQNRNFDDRAKKLALQLDEYRSSFPKEDDGKCGFLNESKPDRIIGWVKVYVNGYSEPVYAPVIPFPTGSKIKAPTSFSIVYNRDNPLHIDRDTDSLVFSWNINENIEGQYVKIYDGMGAAGKSMMFLSKLVDLGKLRSGRPIDNVIASQSFASRRLAWGKRMCTLKTLAMTMSTPPFGYNYAENDAAFPENPDIKEKLKAGRIPIYEWPKLIKEITKFSSDPEVDALLRNMVTIAIKTGTINPSDILATKYGDIYSYMYVDYDFLFDTNLNFQNALMNWYHSMNNKICPPSIEDWGQGGYMFKPLLSSDEYENGCLQVAIPHVGENGKTFYHYENMYLSFSFLNDEYSGMHKIGLNGSKRTLEQLSAAAISGKWLEDDNMRQYARIASAPSNKTYGAYDIELDYGKFIRKER